jgi:hypothetical protein
MGALIAQRLEFEIYNWIKVMKRMYISSLLDGRHGALEYSPRGPWFETAVEKGQWWEGGLAPETSGIKTIEFQTHCNESV